MKDLTLQIMEKEKQQCGPLHIIAVFPSLGAGTTRKLLPVSGSYRRLELNDVVKIHRGYSLEDPKSLARSPRPNVRPPP